MYFPSNPHPMNATFPTLPVPDGSDTLIIAPLEADAVSIRTMYLELLGVIHTYLPSKTPPSKALFPIDKSVVVTPVGQVL